MLAIRRRFLEVKYAQSRKDAKNWSSSHAGFFRRGAPNRSADIISDRSLFLRKWYFTSHLLLEKKSSAFFPTRHRPKMIYKNYYLDESVVVAYFDPTELNGNWPVRRIIIVLSTHLCEKGTQTLKFVWLNLWYGRKFEIYQQLQNTGFHCIWKLDYVNLIKQLVMFRLD